MTTHIPIEIQETIAKGFDFQGCDSHHAEYCACATWEDETCAICAEVIEDGQRIEIVQYPEFWWNPDKNYLHEVWHASCGEEARAITPIHDAYDDTIDHATSPVIEFQL